MKRRNILPSVPRVRPGVNILLNLWFISRFGYVAAAYTTLATYVLYFVFHYFIAAPGTGLLYF